MAGNGAEAVAAVKQGTYDIIFMDVQMPEMDGFTASLTIRQLEETGALSTEHVPIIAMTAHALHGDRQRCLDAGMDDYVSKPLDPRKVFQAIERWAESAPQITTGELKLLEAQSDFVEMDAPEEPTNPMQTVVAQPDEPAGNMELPLDVESALVRFSEDRDFYYNLLYDYLHSLPLRLAEMRAALENGDSQTLSYLAHNLKGVSANFGAWQLAQLSNRLDNYCQSGDLAEAQALLPEVEAAIGRLITHVDEQVGKGEFVRTGD